MDEFKEHDSGAFMNYAWEKIKLPGSVEDDFVAWEYWNRNAMSNKEFRYKIIITRKALSSRGLPTKIQDVVNSQGESIVMELLSVNREEDLVCTVNTERLEVFSPSEWDRERHHG